MDKAAVTAALLAGELGGFATDVHWEEPVLNPASDPLYTHPRVLATPRCAANAEETWDAIASHCAKCIDLARQGRFDELPAAARIV